MPISKTKNFHFYRPILNSDNYTFSDLLNVVIEQGANGKIVTISEERMIVNAYRNDELTVIYVQYLKSDELPKVANESDGKDEQNLEVPQGKSLSYKNVFAYNDRQNLLITAHLHACPQIGRLKMCLREIGKDAAILSKNSDLTFSHIMDRGLVDKIKKAKTITTAEFTSRDYYSGEMIKEKNLLKYEDFLAGKNFDKTTKLKSKNGENIKSVVQFILDDIVGNNDMPDSFDIKMNIDGEDVDFQRYYKRHNIEVLMDQENQKYVDYIDVEDKLINALQSYDKHEN